MMNEKPAVKKFADGSKFWENRFEGFLVKVYIPVTRLSEDIINFGFDAPYLIVFDDKSRSYDEMREYAEKTGLKDVAVRNASSVVFISPDSGNWNTAPEGIFEELIANSKIHQYYENGMAVLNNRFTGKCDGYAIRGAIFRTTLIGEGDAAEYLARNLTKTIMGQGLWGPADVTPAVLVLKNLKTVPKFERRDIPVVSVGNSEAVNSTINDNTDIFVDLPDEEGILAKAYETFSHKYMRWVGCLQECPDFEELNMTVETGSLKVWTTPENLGDYAGSEHHRTGYIAYYNKGLFDKGPAPVMLAFHGGGDSAMYISEVSEWWKVAHDHDFLLVCVENHLNTTAGEIMELLAHLCEQYNIDGSRIYASGFSMGGCKSWDLYQEYPELFAGLAPMSATFEVGLNSYGKEAPVEINREIPVPVFYVGGEISPLPELPCQAQKCLDRVKYVLEVNDCPVSYEVKFEEKDSWGEPVYGISGDVVEKIADDSRGSVLTLNKFKSADGLIYTVFGSVSGQGHECRYHSCENAWKFLSQFRRNEEGTIEII